jgi:cytochrome c553
MQNASRPCGRASRFLIGATLAVLMAALPHGAQAQTGAQSELEGALHATPDRARGQRLFDTCAACHRPDGAGAADGSVPAIAAQRFRVIAQALVNFRHEQRFDERMQHFADAHHLNGAQDIADVAAYVSQLPATHSLGHGPGEQAAHGGQLYALDCASCHGAVAQGDEQRGYARLAGQHYEYLMRQMSDSAAAQRPDLTPQHTALIKSLGASDRSALADYLSRQGP